MKKGLIKEIRLIKSSKATLKRLIGKRDVASAAILEVEKWRTKPVSALQNCWHKRVKTSQKHSGKIQRTTPSWIEQFKFHFDSVQWMRVNLISVVAELLNYIAKSRINYKISAAIFSLDITFNFGTNIYGVQRMCLWVCLGPTRGHMINWSSKCWIIFNLHQQLYDNRLYCQEKHW